MIIDPRIQDKSGYDQKESFNADKIRNEAMIGAVKTKDRTWFFHNNFSENPR